MKHLLNRLRAFTWGLREVHSDITLNFDNEGVQDDYERGRRLAAHIVRRELIRHR